MYIVEKIGDLILITIEDEILSEEIELIKKKLTHLAELTKNDVVVSIYNSDENSKKANTVDLEINSLLKYCNSLGLRVYSYES